MKDLAEEPPALGLVGEDGGQVIPSTNLPFIPHLADDRIGEAGSEIHGMATGILRKHFAERLQRFTVTRLCAGHVEASLDFHAYSDAATGVKELDVRFRSVPNALGFGFPHT